MAETNATVQKAIDSAIQRVAGIPILTSSAYSLDPDNLLDPSICPEMISQPARLKGLGLRRLDVFVSEAAYVGGWELVTRRLINWKVEDGSTHQGLYPLLEPLLGAGSQDFDSKDQRFAKFTDGSSTLGTYFRQAFDDLVQRCPDAETGPLSLTVAATRPVSYSNPKMQGDITRQVENAQAKSLAARFEALGKRDRRRISYQNRSPSTMACFATPPTKSSQVPQYLYTGLVALVTGALDPKVVAAQGMRIGDTNLRVDLHGDALGTAVLPGDRWRRSHDAWKNLIGLDAKFLGVEVQKEPYGLFARFMDPASRAAFNRLTAKEKKTQSIVPDLLFNNHPEGSVIQANGAQMWEIKRIQAVTSFNRTTGRPSGPNDYYRQRRSGPFVKGADRRVVSIPSEYEAKARKADRLFGAPGSSAVLTALRDMPQVQGIALGAFGEFSTSVDLLIEGLAHEGALKNPDKFGQKNYKAAFGQIHWWLKRRWARLAVITAVESRYEALGYTGGNAQRQAAATHTQAQAQDDWREENAFRQRAAEAAAPFLGGFGWD